MGQKNMGTWMATGVGLVGRPWVSGLDEAYRTTYTCTLYAADDMPTK